MLRRLAIALILSASQGASEPSVELSSHVILDTAQQEFGGLSGLEVIAEGRRALVLSDRGRMFETALRRDEGGQITGVTVLRARYLYLYGPDIPVDTEGLAMSGDGRLFVSLESPDSVAQFAPARSWPSTTLPLPETGFERANRGPEALAIDAAGGLITLPEIMPPDAVTFPILRHDGEGWRRIGNLPGDPHFSVVGADIGPRGKLYVLERAVSPLGFRSRIRRMALPVDPDAIETLFESALSQFDNLEGLSIWVDADGRTRLTLVSDNNFLSIQRTEFVEFILRE